MDKAEIARIAAELLALRKRAEAAGALGTAFMIVAAARQAEADISAPAGADAALAEMLAREPAEVGRRYDIDGG